MKKVLSFVLILALVLSSFSMAFAGSATELKTLSDIDGNVNQEAIEVNYDLGIVTGNPDGTFQPAKAVTRAEFAAMITRALAIPQSALAGYANTNFKDTNGYSWAVPYLAFCNSKGIMLGDGAGNAMPGKTITVNEAVTMALRAIGYTANSSELTGVWPSNYVTKAQELKLYDDVAKDAAGVDKANAAQIIYNTLTVQKVAVNSDGETKKLWDKEPTTKSGNTVEGVATTLLTAGLNCEAHEDVVVGGDYNIDDSLINMARHLGKYGTVYTNDDKEIVAFISDCDQLVGRFTDNGTEFKTTDEEKEYNINVTAAAFKLVNGEKKMGKTAIADLKIGSGEAAPKYDVTDKEVVINVDLSGKTVKEIYSVNVWEISDADQIGSSDVADIKDDHSFLGNDFVEEDNDEIDYTQFQLVGVKSLSDIKADQVVYVYADKDGIRRIEVGTQVAEGTVKSFKNSKDNVATKFAIGANTYKNAAEVLNGVVGGDNIVEKTVSNDVKAFLDARGYVYDFKDVSSADNYAVVEKIASTIDDQVKLMLSDGTEKTFTYSDDEEDCGKLATGSVIGYGLDSTGEITDSNKNYIKTDGIVLGSKTTIKTISGAAVMPASGVVAHGTPAVTDQAMTYVTFSAIKDATIDSNCVVFTYDGEDYDVTTIDKVEVNKYITGAVLLFDEENNGTADVDTVVAMIVDDSMAKSGDKSYAVINEKEKVANDDGDKVWRLVGYRDGKDLNSLTDDESTFKSMQTNPVYTKGNATASLATAFVYEVKVDAKGIVTDATKIDGNKYKLVANGGQVTNVEDVHYIDTVKVTKADKRNSISTADGRYTIASDAVIYRLTEDDEFKTYNGELKENDYVKLYETDDDKDGYDIVIFVR